MKKSTNNKKETIKRHEIWLESKYTGKSLHAVFFTGTQKEAIEFCKRAYNFYSSCKLNGVEQNKTDEEIKNSTEQFFLLNKKRK